MTSTIVSSYTSHISHITDNDGDEVKTRCGRTLKNFFRNCFGVRNCSRCGDEADFEAATQEFRTKEEETIRVRKEKSERLRKSGVVRLGKHRQIMADFEAYLETVATDINYEERAGGGEISFVVDGLRFKLSGHIH